MKFSSRISGWPTYIFVGDQVKAVGPIARAPNFTSADSYLRILYKDPLTNSVYKHPILDVISYERDSSVFEIELTDAHRIDEQYAFECSAKIDNHYLEMSDAGLILSPNKSVFTVITDCGDKIEDGGLFKIVKSGNYVMITKNSKLIPVLGQTDNVKMASPFVFSWTGFTALKSLMVIFLKARYFIDHPKLVNNKEKLDEVKQVYNDIGQMLIKDVTGARKENAFYRDENGHFLNNQNKSMTIQEKFDAGLTFGNGTPQHAVSNYDPTALLDDWRHIYPPFAIPPSTLVDRYSNQGVDYQRAVTNESSDSIMNQISYDTAVDAGIIKTAQKLLLGVSIQPAAWDMIQQAVSPVGGFNNVWPCVLIISGNNIGVNFEHPVIRGSLLGTDPLYYKGPYDGYTRERNSTGICIAESPEVITSLSDTPMSDILNSATTPSIAGTDAPLIEQMCPCGGDGIWSKDFTPMHFLILLILVIIVALSVSGEVSFFGDSKSAIVNAMTVI
jgi:hypothetical protein